MSFATKAFTILAIAVLSVLEITILSSSITDGIPLARMIFHASLGLLTKILIKLCECCRKTSILSWKMSRPLK